MVMTSEPTFQAKHLWTAPYIETETDQIIKDVAQNCLYTTKLFYILTPEAKDFLLD